MRQRALLSTLSLLALAASGCMEITYDVNLKEDGSGQVVEVLKPGPKVLRLAENIKGGAAISAQLLSEARCKERALEMGKDVDLTAFKVEETAEGGKKMTAIYSFRDINAIQLCPYPATKAWQDARLKFSYTVSRDPKSRWMFFSASQTNWGNHDGTISGPLEPISEPELQKVRRLLPVFKDMIEGFKLEVNFHFETPEKWASHTRGVNHSMHLNPISIAAGRVVILQLDDKKLQESDDALMVLVPWRQEGAERKLEPMLRFPVYWGGFYSRCTRQWKYIQSAEGREYY